MYLLFAAPLATFVGIFALTLVNNFVHQTNL